MRDWRARLAHRAEWLTGAKDLALALVSPPRRDPAVIALRALVAPVSPDLASVTRATPARPATLPSPPPQHPDLPALASAATRHELEVLAAIRDPRLVPHLPTLAERRRTSAVLELAQADVEANWGDLPAAWLKGTATARLYPEPACRSRKDLDLLVGDRLPEARQALLAEGWQDAVTPRRMSEGPEHVRAWPMTRRYGPFGVSLDLHRRLSGAAWCELDAHAVLSDRHGSTSLDAHADPGAVRATRHAAIGPTSPEDTFLTTLAHLIDSGLHEPMKGWLDLALLVQSLGPEGLPPLIARARRFRMTAALYLSAHVLSRWFPSLHLAPLLDLAPRHAPLLRHLAAGDHDTPERHPIYKGLSQRLWRTLVSGTHT